MGSIRPEDWPVKTEVWGNLGNSCSRDHFYSTRWVQHVATFHILFPLPITFEGEAPPDGAEGNRLRMQPQLRFIQRQDPAFITGTQGLSPLPKTQLWCSDPGAPCCSVRELNSQSLPWNWTHRSPVLLAETPHMIPGPLLAPLALRSIPHHSLSGWVTQVDFAGCFQSPEFTSFQWTYLNMKQFEIRQKVEVRLRSCSFFLSLLPRETSPAVAASPLWPICLMWTYPHSLCLTA